MFLIGVLLIGMLSSGAVVFAAIKQRIFFRGKRYGASPDSVGMIAPFGFPLALSNPAESETRFRPTSWDEISSPKATDSSPAKRETDRSADC